VGLAAAPGRRHGPANITQESGIGLAEPLRGARSPEINTWSAAFSRFAEARQQAGVRHVGGLW
jgi:hypothetical protein